jgi:hypothetical protein
MATLREIRERRANKKKPSLADLRARKQEQKAQTNGLAALRARKQKKRSSKNDFIIDGLKFHNAQPVNGYWTVDITNGDRTLTLHNRYGAWMHDVQGRSGYMKEPVVAARMLGVTGVSQLDICQSLSARLEREMRARGIPTREQLLRQREEAAAAERRKKRKTKDNKDDDNE